MAALQQNSNKLCCNSCHREFSVFIRPHSCELCNQSKLCSNCARKFLLSYEPNASFLRLCNKCCEKVSRGNQLNKSSKRSNNNTKNNSVWSFASSLMGRSSKKQQLSQSSKSKNSTYPLKDQAPLFPDNYNLTTPQRKEKQKIIFRHSTNNDNQQITLIDDEENCYHTMHPLNNLKLKQPKSLLFQRIDSKNQFALNVSINREDVKHYTGNLESSSLCDCFRDDANINNCQQSNDNECFYCIIVPMKHRLFQKLRIDLLFNNKDEEQYISMNMVLYDKCKRIWSGVQIIQINEIKPYQIVSKICVQCNQTLIKKSVTVIGSLSYIIDNNKNDSECNDNYPYKGCNISHMISVLSQQRFDLIDSYTNVVQQRNEVKIALKSDRKKQIDCINENKNHKLYPSEEDGGSKGEATKTEVISNQSKQCDNNITGLEKIMFEHEIARIESMILGLENTLHAIQNNTNNNKQYFEEITSSLASSFMLYTKEINKVKLQIADHLHNDKTQQLIANKKQNGMCDNIEENESDVAVSNIMAKRMIPVCVLCQRCSRTIVLCQKIEDQ